MKANDNDIIDIVEAADLLKLSVKSVRRHIKELPHMKIGRAYRFSRRVINERVGTGNGPVRRTSSPMTDSRIAW